MIYNIKLIFRARTSGNIIRANGIHVQNILHKWMEQITDSKIKTYATTNLMRIDLSAIIGNSLKQDSKYFSVSVGDLFKAFVNTTEIKLVKLLQKLAGVVILFANVELVLHEVHVKNVQLDFQDPQQHKISIYFQTPTALATSTSISVWPNIHQIIFNLILIWKEWIPDTTLDEEYIHQHLPDIQTLYAKGMVIQQPYYNNTHFIGWKGKVVYYVPDKTLAIYIYNLFLLAEYSNIGKGRTAGFGSVKLLSKNGEHNYETNN